MVGVNGGIKRTQADIWFSKCVRERAGWRCEKCGAQHAENSMGLHCSHHHSRRNAGIRLDPLGAESLCYGCHSHYGGTEERRIEALGAVGAALLNEIKNDLNRGREYKRAGDRELSKHYKGEFLRMKAERDSGVTGRIEFAGWL
jgi:hypothetical protein